MSTYDSSTTTYTAVIQPTEAELVRAALAPHVTTQIQDWVGSRDLLALCNRTLGLDQGGPLDLAASVRSVRSGLTDRPAMEALVEAAEPDLLAQADAHLNVAARRAAIGDEVGAEEAAGRASHALSEALWSTGALLSVEERTLTVEAAERSLATMGFSFEVAWGERSTGVWAVRDNQAIAILVQDGGAMETDVAGCAGDTCLPLMEELRQQMAIEGAVLEVTARRPHGDDRGGSLIAQASLRAADGALAAGIVDQFERPIIRSSARRRRDATSSPIRDRR